MSLDQTTLLEQAADKVRNLLANELPSSFVFHNYEHTREVVQVCRELGEQAGLDQIEMRNLLLAAWWHDTGYIKSVEDHELVSCTYAREFMADAGCNDADIKSVLSLIKSTHRDYSPSTRSEKILHDANHAYLGRKRFERRGALLRLEMEANQGREFSLEEWQHYLLDLQLNTKYLTTWAQQKYLSRKNRNTADAKADLIDAEKVTIRRKTGKDYGRGVDTLFRVTLRNHIDLSSIADGKANMIISINTLVLSILITAGTASFSFTDSAYISRLNLILPVISLMFTSLLAIIFAVFSAIPKTSGTRFSIEEVRKHKVSLLFFGNFLQVPRETFVRYLNDLKEEQEVLYNNLSRDLYNLGEVLKRKYWLLKVSYWIFVIGLALSFLIFIITSLFLL